MAIVFNNIKRILRDKSNYLTMLILPVVFIAFSMFGLNGGGNISIGLADNDDTEFTRLMKENLEKNYKVVMIKDSEIQQRLLKNKIQFAVKLDEDMTDELIAGRDIKIKTYNIQETNETAPVRYYLESYVNSAKNIASATKGNEELFYKGLTLYQKGSFKADYTYVEDTGNSKNDTRQGFGFMIMFMLYLSSNAAFLILEDKKFRTFGRILTTPTSLNNYMLQNIISFFGIMLMQLAAVFAIMVFVFKADMGPSVFNIFVLCSVFAVTSVSLGIAISNFSKDIRQANSLSNLIVVPLSMIGGCFWPREIMPKFLQQLSKLDPVSWALDAIEKLLYGSSIGDISTEILILLGFSLVFFILGTNRRIGMKNTQQG